MRRRIPATSASGPLQRALTVCIRAEKSTAPLGNGREKEEVEQVCLPGPRRIANGGHGDENQSAGRSQTGKNFHQ